METIENKEMQAFQVFYNDKEISKMGDKDIFDMALSLGKEKNPLVKNIILSFIRYVQEEDVILFLHTVNQYNNSSLSLKRVYLN